MASVTRSGRWFRVVGAGVASAFFLVGIAAVPAEAAGAGARTRLTGPVTGSVGDPVDDGVCPTNPEFPEFPEAHQRLVGTVNRPGGGETLTVDACVIPVGAHGGAPLEGTFALSSRAGSVTGTISGGVSFDFPIAFDITLHLGSGTRGLKHTTGTLTLHASYDPSVGVSHPFTGTLTAT